MNADDMLEAKTVMKRFGYKDRKSFWEFVHAKGVPHVRLNARVIRFEPAALEDWLQSRRIGRPSERARLNRGFTYGGRIA